VFTVEAFLVILAGDLKSTIADKNNNKQLF